MCGIVGYIGSKDAVSLLLNGLESLEYRGYDSAGVAVLKDGKINLCKVNGRLAALREKIGNTVSGNIGIGHTRWATHGVPAERNAHPHQNNKSDIAVVHNGIIENYEAIREFLKEKGYVFSSETDTEVVPNLIDYFYEGDLLSAVRKAVAKLDGSYALGIISEREPDKMIAVRKDSPLIVGIKCGESFIASDIPAILSETNEIYFLNDNEFVVLTESGVSITDINGAQVVKEVYKVTFTAEAAQKAGYAHFMLKEIHEQPRAILDTLRGRLGKDLTINYDGMDPSFIEHSEKIYIVACGTAYHAGLVGKRTIESLAGIPVEVDLASEFRYRSPLLNDKTLVIVISQSGETADTLASLRMAQKSGSKVLAITNVVGSSVSREADFTFYTYAGPEIAVASTKAYTTQLVALYLFAFLAAEGRKLVDSEYINSLKSELLEIPEKVEEVLKLEKEIEKLSTRIYREKDLFYLGRGLDYAVALEASLKLKEISYIHSETYAGGELKHGPIALIEPGTVVIALSTDSVLCGKIDSNVKEVIARGAYTIGFLGDNCTLNTSFDSVVHIPSVNPIFSPIVTVIPTQMLAYYTSVKKGCDVDKPRNLAKSVTVE